MSDIAERQGKLLKADSKKVKNVMFSHKYNQQKRKLNHSFGRKVRGDKAGTA